MGWIRKKMKPLEYVSVTFGLITAINILRFLASMTEENLYYVIISMGLFIIFSIVPICSMKDNQKEKKQ